MYLTSFVARSGMNAAQIRLDNSAHNVANAHTSGFHRQTVTQQAVVSGGVHARVGPQISSASASGVTLETEIVEQVAAVYAFKANVLVFDTANSMIGTLLDERV